MKIFISREFIAIAILFFLIGFIGTYIYTHNVPLKDALPLVFSIVAAFFAYLTYLYSLEKMRLDLLEKRWEVYKNIIEFISIVEKYNKIPQGSTSDLMDQINDSRRAINAANNSFRCIGRHKVRSLFGPDIYSFFDKLEELYSKLSDTNESSNNEADSILKELKNFPAMFENYMYFGDYTKNRFL